jgi:hypothetical protein
MLSDIYEKYKDQEDGFLYIVYAQEQIYGWSALAMSHTASRTPL